MRSLGKQREFALSYETKKESDITGSVILKFGLTGPGAEACPACGLFTGIQNSQPRSLTQAKWTLLYISSENTTPSARSVVFAVFH